MPLRSMGKNPTLRRDFSDLDRATEEHYVIASARSGRAVTDWNDLPSRDGIRKDYGQTRKMAR